MSLYRSGQVFTVNVWLQSIFVQMKLMRKMRSNQDVDADLQKEQLMEICWMRMRYDGMIKFRIYPSQIRK